MNKEVTWEDFLDYVENVLGVQLCEYQKVIMKETFERSKEVIIIPLG